jgi:hypothetical protein
MSDPLKGFSSTWEAIKHVGGKVLKGAAKGALIVGAISAAVAFFTPMGWMAGIAGLVGLGGGMTGIVTSGLLLGAAAGGGIGLLSGVGSAGEAVDEAQERAMLQSGQKAELARRERMAAYQEAAMAQRLGAGESISAPNVGYGQAAERGLS